MKIREKTMNQHYYNNLAYEMMHGIPLIFDCSFEEHMTNREIRNLAMQVNFLHGHNKIHREPFHLVFSDFDSKGKLYHELIGKHEVDLWERIPYTMTEKSYLDLYPRDKLVYLTPNSKQVLQSFDPNDIYIVGGIVDKATEEPLTFAKAKKQNIRTAKLPLDVYLE